MHGNLARNDFLLLFDDLHNRHKGHEIIDIDKSYQSPRHTITDDFDIGRYIFRKQSLFLMQNNKLRFTLIFNSQLVFEFSKTI